MQHAAGGHILVEDAGMTMPGLPRTPRHLWRLRCTSSIPACSLQQGKVASSALLGSVWVIRRPSQSHADSGESSLGSPQGPRLGRVNQPWAWPRTEPAAGSQEPAKLPVPACRADEGDMNHATAGGSTGGAAPQMLSAASPGWLEGSRALDTVRRVAPGPHGAKAMGRAGQLSRLRAGHAALLLLGLAWLAGARALQLLGDVASFCCCLAKPPCLGVWGPGPLSPALLMAAPPKDENTGMTHPKNQPSWLQIQGTAVALPKPHSPAWPCLHHGARHRAPDQAGELLSVPAGLVSKGAL